ncbi:MAG: hypothetical protein KDK50_02520, partial [Chlamydiia bacterium]|nr:hypothetical protein [Chlamydiia bacterium]
MINPFTLHNAPVNLQMARPECAETQLAQSASQLKVELDQWVQQEQGYGYTNCAAEGISQCYESERDYLGLSRHCLKTLPACLGSLTALRRLDVSWNSLESLPDRIGELKALTELNVSGNKLEPLPDSIGELKALTWLDVSYTQLKSLPESVGGLKALRELNVSKNCLESLPHRIGELKALRKLDVSGNNLESLPDSIVELKALRELDVSYTILESLPESLGKLESLEILSACKNPQLESLPENLSMLSKLQRINLEGCRSLTSIPESWLTLRRECEIVLSRSGLSERYIQHLREITSDADYNGPRIQFSMGSGQNTDMRSLKELLAEIYEIAGCDQPAQLLTNASEFVKGSLHDWLSRLSDTYEYRNGGARKKAGLAKKITEYLELADKNTAFYDAFISLIEGETRDCGDRISLSIMRLGVMKRLVEFDMSDMKGLAELLKKGVWTIGLPAGDTPVMGLLEQC